jgi:predicted Zn-dependent protease
MRALRGWAALLAFGLTLVVGAGCANTTNAATGKKFYNTMTPQQEAELGAKAAPGVAQEYGGAVNNAQLQQYVRTIGLKMAKETESYYPTLNWEFTLLNSPVINAFSLPGGKVFITRGLAERLTNEAQMAGVLGHEIGHVTAQHVAQQITEQTKLNVLSAVAGVVVAASDSKSAVHQYGQYAVPAVAVGGNLYLLKFSRSDESQADYLGMRYMSKVGYDPIAQLQVMQILKEADSGGGGMEMLQTHPLPQTRIDDIKKRLQSDEFKNTQNNPNYGLFPERYQNDFLRIEKTLPPPPKPQPAPAGGTSNLQNSKKSH